MTTEIAQLIPRRGTAAAWTAANPVLAVGERGVETDTGKEKRGDGTTAWNALPYSLPVDLSALATTAALTTETARATAAEATKAPLASPALTGTPTAPTPASSDNSTLLATTAFVKANAGTGGASLGPGEQTFLGRNDDFQEDVVLSRAVRFDPNQMSATNAAVPLTITTPDASGQIVEPAVEFIPWGWHGHKYWALITGYTNGNDQTENPSLYYSDDGITFTPQPGVAFPIEGPPTGGYNDDPEIVLGPDGKLHLFWLATVTTPSLTKTVRWCTYDGTTLTTPQVIYGPVAGAVESAISPVFRYDGINNRWIMWYTDGSRAINANLNFILRRTCPGQTPHGTWSAATQCVINGGPPSTKTIWEFHIALRGDELHIVATFTDVTPGNGTNTILYFGTSDDDGVTWNFATKALLGPSLSGWDSGRMYRADIVALDDGSDNAYIMWYSASATANATGPWLMGRTLIQAVSDPEDRIVAPSWGYVPTTNFPASVPQNDLLMCRVKIKKSGTLMSFAFAPTSASGNVIGCVYDTGDALSGSATLLWQSSAQGMGANVWQVLGHPRLQVKKGQELYFGVLYTGTVANAGSINGRVSAVAQAQLPAGFLNVPGGLLPKLALAVVTAGTAPATISEANLVTTNWLPIHIALVQ